MRIFSPWMLNGGGEMTLDQGLQVLRLVMLLLKPRFGSPAGASFCLLCPL